MRAARSILLTKHALLWSAVARCPQQSAVPGVHRLGQKRDGVQTCLDPNWSAITVDKPLIWIRTGLRSQLISWRLGHSQVPTSHLQLSDFVASKRPTYPTNEWSCCELIEGSEPKISTEKRERSVETDSEFSTCRKRPECWRRGMLGELCEIFDLAYLFRGETIIPRDNSRRQHSEHMGGRGF